MMDTKNQGSPADIRADISLARDEHAGWEGDAAKRRCVDHAEHMTFEASALTEMAKKALPLEPLSLDRVNRNVVYGLNEDGTGIEFDDVGVAEYVVSACNYFRGRPSNPSTLASPSGERSE